MNCVLVTGASGFVGEVLCRALQERGVRVRALLRHSREGPWDEQVIADLGDSVPPHVAAGVDTVFHLAGMAHVPPMAAEAGTRCRRLNVEATESLARTAAVNGVKRFIFMSSVKAGGRPPEECVDERWDGPELDIYGWSKREAEKRLKEVGETTGMATCALRPALVYGRGVKGNLRTLVRMAASGRFPRLPRVAQCRSMVAVEDLAAAAVVVAMSGPAGHKVYCVADGEQYVTADLWDAIAAASGCGRRLWEMPFPVFKLAARAGDLLEHLVARPAPFDSQALESLFGTACYRANRLQKEVGWLPTKTFWEAVPAIVAGLEAEGR